MRTKILTAVLTIILIIGLLGTVNADTVPCTLNLGVSSSQLSEGETLTLRLSTTNITTPVAGFNFLFTYDSSIFENPTYTQASGWGSPSNIENNITILTSDLESTSTTGDVLTITLKVKTGVSGTKVKTTNLTITNAQATTETTSISLPDIIKTVSINPIEDNTNTVDNTTTNNIKNNETSNETSNNISNDTNNLKVNDLPIEKTNDLSVGNVSDKNPDTKLPQTGDNYIITILIVGLSILSAIAYMLYRKNRI